MNDMSKYERLRDLNHPPEVVYLAARKDGVNEISAIRMLRAVFGLSLSEAKKAIGAAEAFTRPQRPEVGATVYWEGADSIDGSWLMQAKVQRIEGDYVYVEDHEKFLVTADGLERVPVGGALLRIPLRYFEKSLAERFEDAEKFWKAIAEVDSGKVI